MTHLAFVRRMFRNAGMPGRERREEFGGRSLRIGTRYEPRSYFFFDARGRLVDMSVELDCVQRKPKRRRR